MKPHPLKVERELRGWSQARVAEAVGTTVRTVIRWEQRQALPYPYYRERLCALFGKDARALGLLEEAEGPTDAPDREQTSRQQPVISPPALPPSTLMPNQFWRVPSPLLPLIGRGQEIEEIKALMTEARLLTLVGAGGVGKTRLSVQLARELRPRFPDGVCFVSLSATSDPEQVLALIAHVLGLRDESQPPYERIQKFLSEKAWLLVLDNFEQVAQAAPELEHLLENCPRVRLLITSRTALRLPAEHLYRLLPLAVPNLKQQHDIVTVAQSPSVQLFLQRARTQLPSFQVTAANAATLANICVRLDGLPLAIELAAARVRLLPPHVLLPRLSRRLHVLTKGSPAQPERQQTLRNTLQWSYDLLDASAQRFFRLLSLFVGGFTVEAAEALFAAVMGQDKGSISSALDGLDLLIDNSLLQPAGTTEGEGEPRLQMLETIREFGSEHLHFSSDSASARLAHASYYLKLAEEAAQAPQGPQRAEWLERLEQEHGNLQAAMEWMLAPEALAAAEEREAGNQDSALRLGNALRWFWIVRGYHREGLQFIEQALQAYEERGAEITPALARATLFAASLSTFLGHLERAERLAGRAMACADALQDAAQMAEASRQAGWIAHQQGQGERALALYERSLTLFKEVDNRIGVASTIHNMAFILQTRGDFQQAGLLLEEEIIQQRDLQNHQGLYGALYQLAQVLFCAEEHPPLERIYTLLQEGLALAEEAGDWRGAAGMQGLLGWVVSSEGRLDEGRGLVEECLRFYREGDRDFYGEYLGILGEILLAQEDYAAAQTVFEECMMVGNALGEKTEIVASALEGMASLALTLGHHRWAVQLWAKAGQRREEIGLPLVPRQRPARERSLDQLRALLGETNFTDLWEEGCALSFDDVWSTRHRLLPHRPTGWQAHPA